MSETTISFTGTANPSDWNTASNWSPGTIPNAATVVAVDDTSTLALVISGGSSDTVGTLDINTTSWGVFVGGSTAFGGTGSGTLTATTINAPTGGGVLVSTAGSTINAQSITGTDIGGGGTFNAPIDDSGGVVKANGGDWDLGALILNGGSISGTGSLEVVTGSTLELNEPTSQNIILSTSTMNPSTTATLQLDDVARFGGTIEIPSGDTLDIVLRGGSITGSTINSGDTLVVTQGGTTENILLSGTSLAVGSNVIVTSTPPVCYAAGTRIATPAGEIAVEDLRVGDHVLTADGRALPIKWIGHRRADCRRHPEPRKVWPVRIQADAFGPGLPARDLRVSPQHGIHVEGVLIPAKVLVNGSTVRQEHVASVEYFHVELEQHEILLAEGLPAESYLDTGDRAAFENGGAPMVLHPDFARLAWDARACAELKVVGPIVERTRARLARRAGEIAAAPHLTPTLSAQAEREFRAS